jgi:hypothetical protein
LGAHGVVAFAGDFSIYRSTTQLIPRSKAMRLIISRPVLTGIIAMAVILTCFFATRAPLSSLQPQYSELSSSSDIADADQYCAQHQADGCWPLGNTVQQVAARNNP